MAYEFDALADLEELQIEKSPDTPNTRLQIASEPRTEHFLKFGWETLGFSYYKEGT